MSKLPNLYHILGIKQSVCNEPDCDEQIKKAYYKRALVSHPDKNKDREDAKQLFELLTTAYEILKDPKTRMLYNHKLKKVEYNDHYGLKKSFEKDSANIEIPKLESIPELEMQVPTTSTNQRLIEIRNIRAQQDKYVPKNVFGDNVTPEKFNAFCDKYDELTKSKQIQKYKYPEAWNPDGNLFSPLATLEEPSIDIDINSLDTEYYTKQNLKDKNYYADIKRRLQERKIETERIESSKGGLESSPYDLTIDNDIEMTEENFIALNTIKSRLADISID